MSHRHRVGGCALLACAICGAVAPAADDFYGDQRPAIYGRVPDDLPAEQPDVRHVGETRTAVGSTGRIVGAGGLSAGRATVNGVGEVA